MSPLAIVPLALVGAPLLLLAAFRWHRALVLTLPFLVILNGVAIPIGASSLHLDQMGVALILVPVVVQWLVGERRLRMDSTVWWLAAILVLNVVASLLHSPARAYSLLQCVNLASVWIIYVVLLNVLDTSEDVERFFDRVLWAALLASAIGIAAFTLSALGFSVGGAEVSRQAAERLTEAFGAYGTMVEPNILGSFTAAHLVMSIALLAVASQHRATARRTHLVRWLALLSSVALVLTFTRAAWLGVVVGLALFSLLGTRALGLRLRFAELVAPLFVALLLGSVLFLLPGTTGTALRFKVLNLINFGSQTVVLRLVTYSLALQQIADHPFIGWGTFTFAPLVAEGADFQRYENWRSLWIGNYFLLALHDTGILGLVAWCGALWSVVARGIRSVRQLAIWDVHGATRALVLTVGVATLLVPFLSTSGFSLGFPWLLMGLLAAQSRLATDGARSTIATSPPVLPDDPPPGAIPVVAT